LGFLAFFIQILLLMQVWANTKPRSVVSLPYCESAAQYSSIWRGNAARIVRFGGLLMAMGGPDMSGRGDERLRVLACSTTVEWGI
jgi:hypothetical protein